MSPRYTAARRAKLEDLVEMEGLPKRLGSNSVGPRSLAFCHPNHSHETLEACFSTFPSGIFVSEDDGQIISFACAIRTCRSPIEEPIAWSDNATLVHQKKGQWLYVKRLAYTAGPGHAHLSKEIGPLLTAFQALAIKLDLKGVAFPARFWGFQERMGTTSYQKSVVDDPHSQERSGLRPIGIACSVGFRHEIALPNYLGDGKHFALMTWRNER